MCISALYLTTLLTVTVKLLTLRSVSPSRLQKFLLFMSPSPGPARAALTSICSRKLSSPNHPVDPVPAERIHVPVPLTRAAFAWLWSSGKDWFPDSSYAYRFLIPCRLLPQLYVIVIAVEHQHILLLLRREYLLLAEPRSAAPCSAPRPVVVARRKPLRKWLGGHKMSSRSLVVLRVVCP